MRSLTANNEPKPKLKYLFGVHYYDGTYFYQNPDDLSITQPGKSAFTDVRKPDVYRFWLTSGTQVVALVDLSTGDFEIFGEKLPIRNQEAGSFSVGNKSFLMEIQGNRKIEPLLSSIDRLKRVPTLEEGRLELVFFRRHRQSFEHTVKVNDDLKPEVVDRKEVEHRIWYRIGWKSSLGADTTQHIVTIG